MLAFRSCLMSYLSREGIRLRFHLLRTLAYITSTTSQIKSVVVVVNGNSISLRGYTCFYY